MGDQTPASGSDTETGKRHGFGERRVITALFCDIVNSTTLGERLDPEDLADLFGEAFEQLTAPVLRYEGSVNKLMGDALLAFFGAPVAHEDDPQRAVLAGLDILDAAKNYAKKVRRLHRFEFEVRVGINTGPVVVGDVGAGRTLDHTALGDAVNVAARMQHAAAPGTVQISADTYRLVAPLFDVESLGEIELKGKSERIGAYRVLGVKAQPGRLRGLDGVSAPLIGRDRELHGLKGAVDALLTGRGQIVTLLGEAGLGKSRLLTELATYWGERSNPDFWEVMVGVPYDASRPFGLFQNFARGIFGVDLEDPAEVVHDKVVRGIRRRGGNDEATALCSIAFERVIAAKTLHDAKQQFSTEAVRQDIYDVMYPAFRESCMYAPTVVVIDDAHWADSASIDLMTHLLRLTDEVPLLVLLAMRPERQAPAWKLKQAAETEFPHRYLEINLQPLAETETDELVSNLLSIADLPAELRSLIMKKAEGNPYFVEEIVRTLVDDGVVYRTEDGLHWKSTAKVSDITIPSNLQALLTARIDRLDQETKSTLQVASVIGRSFYYRVLQAISDSAMAVDKHLRSLERVELLRESNRMPELEYMFRHELARDAAYASILNRRRREFHHRVGEAIERLFSDRIEEHAHRLAQHFSLAGDLVRASRYFEMAGDSAVNLHAGPEATMHFEHALEAARAGELDAAVVARIEGKRAATIAAAA